MKKRQSLLDDDADVANLGIKVNKDYAARFEHNKEREELHRLQAKHPAMAARIARQSSRRLMDADEEEDDLEDESSSEEEDLGEIPDETEAKILETLVKIKRKDPAIYQSDVRFFEKEEDQDDENAAREEDGSAPPATKSKPKFLKDMIAQNLLKHGPEIEEEEEEDVAERGGKKRARAPKAYDDEQEQLRKAFISAAGDGGDPADGDDFGGVLKPRVKSGGKEEEEEEEEEDHPKKGKKGSKKKIKRLVDDFFGSESKNEDSNDRFLREYILNKGWEDKAGDEAPSYQDVVGREDEEGGGGGVDDEEDEEYLEEADRFEASYNFRFEEPGGTKIAVHPRIVEGLVRKTDDKRKRQRAEKAQRLEEERSKHADEVKRLKNLKMKEIEDKIAKLQKVAGGSLAPTAGSKMMDALLEGDFDPEAWDRQMQEAFDDGYYAEDDAELDALLDDLEDPELKGAAAAGLDPELAEILGEDDQDLEEEEEEEERKRRKKKGASVDQKEELEVGTYKVLKKKLAEIHARAEDEEEEDGGGNKEARLDKHRAEIQRLMDEYYKLDFEDSIGGLRTRFKYKHVPAQNFGLSAEDILNLSDKDLNQVVGMKRLAPYRDDEERPQRPNYKALELLSSHQQMSSKKSNKRERERKKPIEDLKRLPFKKEGFKKPRQEPSASAAQPEGVKGKVDVNKRQKYNVKASAAPGKFPSKEEAAASRIASYAKLELRPGQGAKAKANDKEKRKEKKKPAAEPQASLVPPGLTKAQKKNFKRSLKRAKKD